MQILLSPYQILARCPAAIGFAQAANLPFELGIIRNHYVGRTFIQPEFDPPYGREAET